MFSTANVGQQSLLTHSNKTEETKLPSWDMTDSVSFGRTDFSAEEYLRFMREKRALDVLKAGGVQNPSRKLNCFTRAVPALASWLEKNGRDFPWRRTDDPWKVYISEILLQRTRAEAVADVYGQFFSKYPDPESVIDDRDGDLFEIVRPLGFGEQRTRTIQEAAELCVNHFGSDIPENLDKLKEPWRVGPYSARATLMFAFGHPCALVDSNMARIFGRIFGYPMPDQPHKAEEVYELIEALKPENPEMARSFALGLLDLGALVCTPEDPRCSACVFNECCEWSD